MKIGLSFRVKVLVSNNKYKRMFYQSGIFVFFVFLPQEPNLSFSS